MCNTYVYATARTANKHFWFLRNGDKQREDDAEFETNANKNRKNEIQYKN